MDETWIGRKIKAKVNYAGGYNGITKGKILEIEKIDDNDGTYKADFWYVQKTFDKEFELVELTKEELLEKAKKDYPEGTVIYSEITKKNVTIGNKWKFYGTKKL